MSELPELPIDPEAEMLSILYGEFLELGFTMTEARQLAEAWASPDVVEWEMARGCSYKQAVRIYG